MKRMFKMSLLGLLALGLTTSCEDENKNKNENNENLLDIEVVYVEGGEFEMGATDEQGEDAENNEKPVRTIKLNSYSIGKYEITQAQWKAVMGTTVKDLQKNAAWDDGIVGEGNNYPIYYVSWDDAQEFCKRLSEKTGKNYVLPTEAQWEYAARGGNKSNHTKYAGSNDPEEVAWHVNNCDLTTHPVGDKKPNELGIYDMSGNVWEWCSDWFSRYNADDTDNPQGPASGAGRVARGGSWYHPAVNSRVAARNGGAADTRFSMMGLRVVLLP